MSMINYTELNAAFGAFCLTVSQELKEMQIYANLQSVEEFGIRLVTGIRDREQFALPYVTDVLQQGTGDFNGVANVINFEALEWQMRAWCVNHEHNERSVYATFLQHYVSASRASGNTMELVQFMFAMILKKMRENLELAIWQGVYNPVKTAPNTAYPLRVVNGFLQLIVDDITALRTTPVATGAITTLNAVANFEEMYEALTPLTQQQPSVTFCSVANALKFIKNYIAINGSNDLIIASIMNEWNTFKTTKKFPKIPLALSGGLNMIQPVWGMGTSNRLITTSMVNGGMMAVGMGEPGDLAKIKTDEDIYKFRMAVDGSISCNMGAYELDGELYTVVNDQV